MEQTYQPVHFEKLESTGGFVLNGDQEFTFQMNRHRYWDMSRAGVRPDRRRDLRRMLCEPADRLDRKMSLGGKMRRIPLGVRSMLASGQIIGYGLWPCVLAALL